MFILVQSALSGGCGRTVTAGWDMGMAGALRDLAVHGDIVQGFQEEGSQGLILKERQGSKERCSFCSWLRVC